jgi:putative transcriptional regulator
MTAKIIDSQTIGERLRSLRGAKTQKEIGDAIGVTATAISQYERGERVPADDIKVALARYFNSTVEAIFFTF